MLNVLHKHNGCEEMFETTRNYSLSSGRPDLRHGPPVLDAGNRSVQVYCQPNLPKWPLFNALERPCLEETCCVFSFTAQAHCTFQEEMSRKC